MAKKGKVKEEGEEDGDDSDVMSCFAVAQREEQDADNSGSASVKGEERARNLKMIGS